MSGATLYPSVMISAQRALERLQQGNLRFVSGKPRNETGRSRHAEMTREQAPFAIVLGCSDSRVPAEIVFDQWIGDLFVIRVAGNIVVPPLTGSVEFAASNFGTRLVVVLGHSDCGAVTATVEQLRQSTEMPSRNLSSIVERIRPGVEGSLDPGLQQDTQALIAKAVRANVTSSVNHLKNGSEILQHLIQDDGLLIIGAECSLETGEVEFFEA